MIIILLAFAVSAFVGLSTLIGMKLLSVFLWNKFTDEVWEGVLRSRWIRR